MISRTKKIAVVSVVGVVAMVLGMSRLQLSNEISSMLPLQDEVVRDYFQIAEEFKTLESLYIDVSGELLKEDGLDRVTEIADQLYERLQSSGHFSRIYYRIDESLFLGLADTLQRVQPALLSESDMKTVEQRLRPDAVHQYLTRAKRSITTSLTPMAQRRLQSDPFDFMELSMDGFASVGNQSQGARIVDGRIVSPDGRHILLFAVPNFPPEVLEKSESLIAFLEEQHDALGKIDDRVIIRFAGGHFAYTDNARVVKKDLSRTIPAMVVGIVFISVLFFRRKFAVILILAPVAFGTAFALAIFSVMNPIIPGLVVGCAALLIGISVDYGIHLLHQLDDDDSESSADIRSTRFSTLIGATTTVAALLSLQVSSIEGQRQLGLLAALGVAGSAFFALTILPRLAKVVPRRSGRMELSRFFDPVQQFTDRYALIVSGVLVIAGLVSIAGLQRLQFDGDLQNMSYLKPPHQNDDRIVRGTWQAVIPSSVVLQGEDLQQVLEENDRLDLLLRGLQDEGVVADVMSVSGILPSHATQRARWTRWQKFWSNEQIATLRSNTESVADELGFTSSAFEPFFEGLSSDPTMLDLADYEDGGLHDQIASRVSISKDHTLVQSSFFVPDLETFLRVKALINEAHPNAIVMDGRWFKDHTRRLVSNEMIRLGLVASTVVMISLLILFGSIELMIVVLMPVLFGLILTLGILGWIGIPINLVSSLFIVFVLGVGVDFNIFLVNERLSAYRHQSTANFSTGSAVVLCAVTTLFGFASLTLAQHPAIHSMGITGFVGIASCLLSSFLFVPLVVRLILPEDGRYGVGTLDNIACGLWSVAILMSQVIAYVMFVRPFWYLKYLNNHATRQRRVRRFMRTMVLNHLSRFPYRRSPRIYENAEAETLKKPAILVSNHQ
ncbi:MAG: MMPL family transporter, partial [Candidatus Hydrogenedentota bacterium]